jgi:hypothetical protein
MCKLNKKNEYEKRTYHSPCLMQIHILCKLFWFYWRAAFIHLNQSATICLNLLTVSSCLFATLWLPEAISSMFLNSKQIGFQLIVDDCDKKGEGLCI